MALTYKLVSNTSVSATALKLFMTIAFNSNPLNMAISFSERSLKKLSNLKSQNIHYMLTKTFKALLR